MRSTASVMSRLTRMEQQGAIRTSEEHIRILADEFNLDPGEVRQALDEITRHNRKYGPEPEDVQIHRLAKEHALDEAEIREEYELIRSRLRERGMLI